MKRIVCLGGGPAGLYSAILLKKALPNARVEVYERNRPDDTFGWGVVFSDKTMAGFRAADAADSHAAIVGSFHHWDDVDVHFGGRAVRSGGHGFCGIAASACSNIFQERAAALGVEQYFRARGGASEACSRTPISSSPPTASTAGSARATRTVFKPHIDVRKCRFIWLGTHAEISGLHLRLRAHRAWLVPDPCLSVQPRSLHGHRRDARGDLEGARARPPRHARLDRFLRAALSRAISTATALMSNANHLRGSAWLNFNRVLASAGIDGKRRADRRCGAHGALRHRLGHQARHGGCDLRSYRPSRSAAMSAPGSSAYHAERNLEVLKLQSAARNRMEWFENVARYTHLDAASSSPTACSPESAHRPREPQVCAIPTFVASYGGGPRAPLRARARGGRRCSCRFSCAGMELANRVVVSPMAQYCAHATGMPDDWHLVHYGARALGGAGLVVTEMTCVCARGAHHAGMHGALERGAARRLAAHRRVRARRTPREDRVCSSATPAARARPSSAGSGMDHPLPEGNWPLVSPSPIPYLPGISQTPREMTRAQTGARCSARFVRAARLGARGRLRHARAAHGARLSAGQLPLAAHQPPRR